jgi:hypothetical protein
MRLGLGNWGDPTSAWLLSPIRLDAPQALDQELRRFAIASTEPGQPSRTRMTIASITVPFSAEAV